MHLVRSEMDAGPIIMQAAVPVMAGDDEDSLAARVLTAEHRCYPHAVRLIAEGRAAAVEGYVDNFENSATAPPLFNPPVD